MKHIFHFCKDPYMFGLIGKRLILITWYDRTWPIGLGKVICEHVRVDYIPVVYFIFVFAFVFFFLGPDL